MLGLLGKVDPPAPPNQDTRLLPMHPKVTLEWGGYLGHHVGKEGVRSVGKAGAPLVSSFISPFQMKTSRQEDDSYTQKRKLRKEYNKVRAGGVGLALVLSWLSVSVSKMNL